VKKRFTEERIIGFLREAEQGVPVKELSTHGSLRKSSGETRCLPYARKWCLPATCVGTRDPMRNRKTARTLKALTQLTRS